MLNNLMAQLAVRVEDLKGREDGQGMIEYALLAALISVIAIIAITAVGVEVNGVFEAIQAALPGA